MTEIPIDKNVPMPPDISGSKYPFQKMEVGDSFIFTGKAPNLCSLMKHHGQKLNRKFTSRREGTGRRVWRIA